MARPSEGIKFFPSRVESFERNGTQPSTYWLYNRISEKCLQSPFWYRFCKKNHKCGSRIFSSKRLNIKFLECWMCLFVECVTDQDKQHAQSRDQFKNIKSTTLRSGNNDSFVTKDFLMGSFLASNDCCFFSTLKHCAKNIQNYGITLGIEKKNGYFFTW